MPNSLHDIPSFIKINKDGQGYNPHFHTGSEENGYTLYFHTAGGGKCLNSNAHTAGSFHMGRSILTGPMYFLSSLLLLPPAITAVFGSYLSSLYSLLTLYRGCGFAYPYDWRGFVGAKKKTSVVLSVFNSSTVYIHNVYCTGSKKRYKLHVHTTSCGRDTPCTSILLVMEMDTPCRCILLSVEEKDTLCTPKIHVVEGDTPCTSIHS
jgi:hypothetical protein